MAPPPAGGWPVVAWAHGTIGVADVCAPSRWADFYEYGDYLRALTEAGFVVVATDYEGLGTPGDHPYLDAEGEARSVVDSVRAVRHLVADVTDTWVSIGHSQGGQAALVAGQHARDPDVPLAGVVGIAPASSLHLLPLALTGSPEQGYLAFAAAGIVAVDPSVELDDLMGPDALAATEVLDRGCWYEVMEAFRAVDPGQMSAVTDAGPVAVDAYLERNEPGTTPIDRPVLLVQGGDDDTVPQVITELLRDRLCAQGTATALAVYDGLGHDDVLTPSLADTVTWMKARFAGEAAVDECPPAAG
jgi:acetyl esterase/lipase